MGSPNYVATAGQHLELELTITLLWLEDGLRGQARCRVRRHGYPMACIMPAAAQAKAEWLDGAKLAYVLSAGMRRGAVTLSWSRDKVTV